jgi:prepilin-type N-terminal cleavage/methylation domain-containing protein
MRGFTLIELLVGVLIFAFLMSAIFAILNIGDITYNSDVCLLNLQQQARLAMDGMVRELRQSSSSDISIVSDSEIIFNISPETYGSGWIGPIRYYLDAPDSQIIREYPAGTEKIVANNVDNLVFSLNGRKLDIQLSCAEVVRQRNFSFSLRGEVKFRNE